MKTARKAIKSTFTLIAALSLIGWNGLVLGQTFSSGSTGALNDLSPTANTVVTLPPDGVLNYTTITIPAGVTVTFQRNAANTPVTLLATGDVTINGAINVNGSAGAGGAGGAMSVSAGGPGGPGGFKGGNGALTGGVSATAGHGPGGAGAGGGGLYGAPGGFVALVPLFGGSGGGGNSAGSPGSGPAGGGGGGAIVIASSSKVVISGSIVANGGIGGFTNLLSSSSCGGSGSGGAIRLVAPLVTNSGSVQAIGGNIGGNCAAAGLGKIRVEAFNTSFTGSFNPVLGNGTTVSIAPGPVSPASNPALVALPSLRIASVGALAAPADPVASYAQGDITLPQGTVNPVPVVVAATNMPTNASVIVRLIPQSGAATTLGGVTPAGTFLSSAATASVNFPAGTVSLVQAWATMTLTGQIASLFPLIDGEPVESVAIASPLDDGRPVLNLVTKSGKERRVDELSQADRVKFAVAWQAMAASR